MKMRKLLIIFGILCILINNIVFADNNITIISPNNNSYTNDTTPDLEFKYIWDIRCEGTPNSCSNYNTSTCSICGCALNLLLVCFGTPITCNNHNNEGDCNGCSCNWDVSKSCDMYFNGTKVNTNSSVEYNTSTKIESTISFADGIYETYINCSGNISDIYTITIYTNVNMTPPKSNFVFNKIKSNNQCMFCVIIPYLLIILIFILWYLNDKKYLKIK